MLAHKAQGDNHEYFIEILRGTPNSAFKICVCVTETLNNFAYNSELHCTDLSILPGRCSH